MHLVRSRSRASFDRISKHSRRRSGTVTGAGNSRYGTGDARRGESSCRGKNRRFRHVIRGITACPTALLLFTACDADTAVDASARPAYSVTAGAPAYALTPTSVNIQINEYFRFQALLTDGSGTKVSDVTYTTSNPSVATVNAYGTVRGRGNGTTTLTATSPTYGVSTAAVNVGTAVTAPTTNDPLTTATTKPEMKMIALTPATVSVAAGTTTQLSAVAKDQYGTAISGVTFIWTSADTAIATVSTTGALTGATPGQTSIRATSGGISATTSVTV